MKIERILLAVLTLTAISSCQPKDVVVTRPGAGGSVNQNSARHSSLEFDKLLVLSLDRSFEAVHLLKAVLNSTYAESKNLRLSKDKSQNTVLKVITPRSPKKNETKDESFYTVNYEVQALQVDENGKLISLVLKNIPMMKANSSSFNASGSDFASKALNEFVSIRLGSNANEYIISFDRLDDTSSKADKQSNLVVTGVATLVWDGKVESLDQPLPMTLRQFYVDRKGNKTGYMDFKKVTSKDLFVQVNDCISVNGNVTLTQEINASSGKFEKVSSVNYSDSSVVVTEADRATYSYTAKDCASRPVIDFTKML